MKRKCDRYRRAGEGGAPNSLGILYGQQRRYTEAVACFEHSLTLRLGAASTVNNLGEAYARLGALDQAIVLQREGLKRSRTLRPGACSATSRSSTWPP